uniref:Uncharacterized protein n=1 Tax=Trypanosoma congolense (strain IL3000) TaxID=1068625 RepID=G0URQ7_TRYCI|nr:conserved hypothetical protein [Trypanosoma congolense IL3000]
MELHIFDFDGTIFNSPVPSTRLKTTCGAKLYDQLHVPLQSGGLGWFQSINTLSPPAVPEKPGEKWYITPILEKIRRLHQQQKNNVMNDIPESILIYVLTGRDEKFRRRITELLDNAGVLAMLNGVLLKPGEVYGTVKFKLESIYNLIAKNQPTDVFYYEDRVEQGRKLLEGINYLSKAVNKSSSSSGFVITKMMQPDGGLFPFEGCSTNCSTTEKDECAAAKRWWSDTRRRVDPYPLSCIKPFSFALIFVDQELTSLSGNMLTAKEEDALVGALRYESDAYKASNHTPNKANNEGRRNFR